MRDVRTAGIVRRGAALAIDAMFALGLVAVLYGAGVFRGEPFRPPADWFWTEWWFKTWLDDPRVFIDPVIGFCALLWAWTSGWEAANGRTPGDRLLRIRVVDRYGDRPTVARQLARAAATLLNVGSLGLGWLWIVVSPTRRAWHDYASGTWTIVDPAETA